MGTDPRKNRLLSANFQIKTGHFPLKSHTEQNPSLMPISFPKGGAIALLACAVIHPQVSFAEPGDGVTIGDVAAMEPHKAIKYVHNEASLHGLKIGMAEGDAALNCLKQEFVSITMIADGSLVQPRGLKAAIQLVHRHNNNGGEKRLAAEQIDAFVDMVAERFCGVSASTLSEN
jgi:hypothetical protein